MRVGGRELPLSAIPLCQLFPCHLGPPRPMLSINLYVKGCLDCTIEVFHMSIPSESSLLQNEVQISLNLKISLLEPKLQHFEGVKKWSFSGIFFINLGVCFFYFSRYTYEIWQSYVFFHAESISDVSFAPTVLFFYMLFDEKNERKMLCLNNILYFS